MADLVHKYLTTELQLDFNECRGQSYDNAANMAGRYNGMQQKSLERNEFAKFIPCAGHSLNLLGRSAVDCCLDAVNCFGIINTGTEEQSISLSHGDLYEIMCKEKIHTAFPNVEAILRLFLSLMVTNCSGERSFSRLKSIKNKQIDNVSRKVVCTEHSVH